MSNNFSDQNNLVKLQERCAKKMRNFNLIEAIGCAFKELIAYYNILQLLKWADQKVNVTFHPNINNAYNSKQRTITINSNLDIEEQLFTLIHECGHHLIYENYNKNSLYHHTRFTQYGLSLKEETRNRLGKKIYTIAEEVEAWVRGFNLIRKDLNLNINKQRFENYKNKNINLYVAWANSKKGN